MLPSLLNSIFDRLSYRWPLLLYATVWTILLTMIVAVASFTPEVAFVSAISPISSFSQACSAEGSVRVPLDIPGEIICLPAHRFMKSKIDFIVPPIFAAVVVTASAFVVRASALWEDDFVHWIGPGLRIVVSFWAFCLLIDPVTLLEILEITQHVLGELQLGCS